MKIKFLLLFLWFGMLFVSCKKQKTATKNLEKYMLNTWQTSYIKIEMPTAYGKDSTYVFEDNFSKKNAILAQSIYKNDGTFTAWYLHPNKTKTGETHGTWKIKGDSLLISYTYLGKESNPSYYITKTNEGFEAKSIYDWDNDKEKDDILIMKTKKINF